MCLLLLWQLVIELGIVCNMVIYVYEQFGVEGYVLVGVGSGIFVVDIVLDWLDVVLVLVVVVVVLVVVLIIEVVMLFVLMLFMCGWVFVCDVGVSLCQWGVFMFGVLEVWMFLVCIWLCLYNWLLCKLLFVLLMYFVGVGYLLLCIVLVDYLCIVCGVCCELEQIIIMVGIYLLFQFIV